jgi:hypothetical protein
MQPKYSIIWIITAAVFVIAACSVSPTIAVEEPTFELPPPTVVQTAITPTDSPTAIPVETVAPTFTTEIPTDIPASGVQSSIGQGDQIMQSVCTVCHSPDRIVNSHKTQAEWETTVNRMISHGAVLSDSDKAILLLYLSETYK